METQAFKKERKEENLKERIRNDQKIYDTGRNAIKPETTIDTLARLTKIAGETTQVYKNLLEAIGGVKRLSGTIGKNENVVPSASEIANNLGYAIEGISVPKRA